METKAILRQTILAARALADLKGIAAKIPNQAVLVSGIVSQEARLSSEIENIVTTSDELYRAAASPEEVTDPQTKEVLRYREALWHDFRSLHDRPLSTNLFVEIVSQIRGVQMEIRRVPGTTLKTQTGEVIYTPPMGEALLREELGNLETFLHAEDGPDPLIRLAVMHYQFEAIHPFTAGNGSARMGCWWRRTVSMRGWGSLSAAEERFMAWRTIDGKEKDPLGQFGELEILVRGVFEKEHLLDYLRNFIVFEDDGGLSKKIAAYHQFHAVRAVVSRVLEASAPGGSGKGGVVRWEWPGFTAQVH